MKTKTSEVKEHSEFGGSQAKRIRKCPASVKASRGVANVSSAKADEGTDAHACLEFIINNRLKLKKESTRKKVLSAAKRRWDKDMIMYALDALTYLQNQMGPGSELIAEQKLDTSKFTTDDQSSTLDATIINWKARELIIADYKYGTHPVDVKMNDQLIYYALGMLIKLRAWKHIDRIRLVIIQPRAHHKDGPNREYFLSVDQAVKWGRRFKKTVRIALGKNPPYNYGSEWCYFCLAKPKCKEYAKQQVMREFENVA